MADYIQIKNGSTDAYPVVNAERETLATNIYLTRIGNVRILNIDAYSVTGASITIPVGDRPITDTAGFGIRSNGGTWLCAGITQVLTSGSVNMLYINAYNVASTGYSYAGAGDVFIGLAIWTI